jgi:anti-sigma B factor antagonist
VVRSKAPPASLHRDEEASAIELSMDVRTEAPWTVLDVAGELDLSTAPQLRKQVILMADEGARRVALDFTRVDFIDSSGLGAIVASLKHLRELGGELALIAPEGSSLSKLVALTGLGGSFSIYAGSGDLPAG